MSGNTINPALLNALEKAWSKETAYPLCQPQYDEKHPSWGNCFVSAIVVWAETEGEDIIAGKADMPTEKGLWHFRNTGIDATWAQFDEGSTFRPAVPRTAEYQKMIMESVFNDPTLENRLAKFVERLETEGGYRISKPVWQMIEQLQTKFDAVHHPNYLPPTDRAFTP